MAEEQVQQQVENNDVPQEQPQKQQKHKRESPYVFDKSLVTAETPIPQAPKQKERLSKPDDDQMKKKQDQIQKKIEDVLASRRAFIDNLILQNQENKESNKQGTSTLRDQISTQIEENKEKQTQFAEIKQKFDAVKQKQDALIKEVNLIKGKLKQNMSLEDLEDMLDEKQSLLENGTLTGQQEKRIIQEVDNLKKILPSLQKIAPLEEEIDVLRQEKSEIKKIYVPLLEELNKGRDMVRDTKQELDDIRDMTKQQQEKLDPIISKKKEEFQAQIDELREQKKQIFSEYKQKQKEYYEQQDLIRYSEWVRKHVERIKRDERRKKRDEEIAQRQKQEQEEIDAQNKIVKNPYLADIATCEQLLTFCKSLQQQHQQKAQQDSQIEQSQQQQINESELEKQGLTLINKKKDDDDFLGGNKAKKGKKKFNKSKQQQGQEPSAQVITLGITDLNDFATVKITPPKDISELQRVIDQLQEKKKYLEELPLPESNEKQESEEQQENTKKGKKFAQIENEEDYPEL